MAEANLHRMNPEDKAAALLRLGHKAPEKVEEPKEESKPKGGKK